MKRLFLFVTLIVALTTALSAGQVTVGQYQNEIRMLDSTPDHMIMELTLGQFTAEPVMIDGQEWYNLSLKKAGLTLEAGCPQVPVLAGSVIIPNTAGMELSLVSSEYVELSLPVAPSKGNLTRDINPDSVPYTFGDVYSGNGCWPAETSLLTEPFILRDYRGITVQFKPFVYYPATQTLRVYTRLRVALDNTGTDYTNSLPAPRTSYAQEFTGIYESMFLNFGAAKYPSLAEEGRILAIKHSMFDAVMQPWVDWKRQNGYTVDVVDVSVAGPTATQIMAYIQAQYNLNNGLMFVQIFGDAPQVPTLSSGGGGSDPSFALLAGGDSYPDIYVGRFSAQTVAEMQTQIERSVYYERDIQTGATWLQRGMGIASNEGGGSQGDMGESDQAHMELIRTDWLNYGHDSVDQMYQTMGATAAQVGANVNAGRGIINYCGHGSDTYWVTTGFSNTNVNALTNDWMLPFIVSVACVNGNFVSQTCFAEAWLRSVNETTNAPAGAIAMYASTINQGWNPPMRGQDEVNDLFVGEQKRTVGGMLFNGSSKMIEVYGTSGINEYKTWTIFGDASLMLRSKDPQPLTAVYNPVLFLGMGSFQVETIPGARVTLSTPTTVFATGIADASGIIVLQMFEPPLEPMDLTLTITAFNKVTHLGTVQVLPASGPYLIVDNMVVTDANNNLPEFNETITLNFSFSNVGTDPATDVSVTISTQDQYLSIINSSETIADIPASGSGGTSAGFQVSVADNVPDQHAAQIHVAIQAGTNSYEYNRNIVLNAPAFTWGPIEVQDYLGNNNGMIDPGESVTLVFPVINNGHAQADNLIGALVIPNVMHVVEPIATMYTSLPQGGEAQLIYFVTFSSQIPTGTTVNLNTLAFAGEYGSSNNYAVNLGIVMENFENTFNAFPWQFSGGNWTIDPTSHDGSNAAKSALITHSQTTSMSVTMQAPTAGTISFWKKVSSEQNYDYLRFYINNTLKNQWSGTSDVWSMVSYDVAAGMNTFKWEYAKDNMVSAGSDCAWIDNIIFPAAGGVTGTPILTLETTEVNFGNVFLGERSTVPYTITNSGDAVLIGSLTTAPPFSVSQGNGQPNNMVYIIVPAQSYLTVDLHFTPAAEGPAIANLAIATDDPVNPLIDAILQGTGAIVSNDDPTIPAVTELQGNFPNPFNPSTTIRYGVKEASAVTIEIYNIKGQLVRTLVKETKGTGFHEVVFDGLDNNKAPLSSGVYFYKMQAEKYSDTRKMILMK